MGEFPALDAMRIQVRFDDDASDMCSRKTRKEGKGSIVRSRADKDVIQPKQSPERLVTRLRNKLHLEVLGTKCGELRRDIRKQVS